MRALLAVSAFFAFLMQSGTGRIETLVLPHALRSGETAWLEVKVGAIPHGAEIEVTTTEGHLLGVISPFGIRPRKPAGTYTLPLPAEAISNGRVSVRISLNYAHKQRAPSRKEVKKIRLRVGR